MTYNEWRDELKSNLLCVSESERRRVLDYYAEAYADRRDAGFTEREIIEEFGAPYDAAHRLLDTSEEYFEEEKPYSQRRREKREERREARRAGYDQTAEYTQHTTYTPPSPPPPQPAPKKKSADYTWVFVLLCIIFAVPLFFVIMGMVGITVGLFVAPLSLLISGAATAGAGIGVMVGGEFLEGMITTGSGLIVFGLSVILLPLFVKLISLMWKLFKMLFKWLKGLFAAKEI